MILSKRFFVPISLLLVLAPLWKPEQLKLFGRGLFIQSDIMVALGLSLLFAFLTQKLLPTKVLTQLEVLIQWATLRTRILSILFLAIILASFITTNKLILNSFLSSADEHSSYFLAETLRLNRFWVSAPPIADFFDVVHVGNRAGKWFSVYPPGWPLIWAVGLSFDIADYLNPLMVTAALAFCYLAGKRVLGSAAAKLGIILVSLAPFFMFTSASYFSHPTCFLMISIFLFAYTRYAETESKQRRVCWAVLAATGVGYGLLTRYLTMAAVSGPFFIYEVWQRFKLKSWSKSDIWPALALGTSLGLILYQNWTISGNLFIAPNKYDKDWEELGFDRDYTPLDGLIFIIARFFYLMDWFPPILVFLFFLFLLSKQRVNSLQRLFQWGFFYPVAAYFFYYSWGGGQYGPRYYYEGFLFMGLVVGQGVVSWWKLGTAEAKKLIVGMLFAALVSNGYLIYKQSEFFSTVSSQRKSLYELAQKTIESKAIVFIRGHLGKRLILTQDDAVRNHPLLNTKILYAHDLGGRNKELMALYPERDYYLGYYDGETLRPVLQRL